jgi:hypothetical protein
MVNNFQGTNKLKEWIKLILIKGLIKYELGSASADPKFQAMTINNLTIYLKKVNRRQVLKQ